MLRATVLEGAGLNAGGATVTALLQRAPLRRVTYVKLGKEREVPTALS